MKYTGPITPAAAQMHAEKYRGPGESFDEFVSRVSRAVSDDDAHFHRMRDILGNMLYLPGGRIQSAAGSMRRVTAYNCFVSGTLQDSFTDGDDSIMGIAAQAAQTMRMGGGIGYDFSVLRPRGALIKSLSSKSSGPLGFMPIFNAIGVATASAGNRRGAQMGVLRVDHPDIIEFVRSKHDQTSLTGFNISVGITDEFMEAVFADRDFDLRFGGVVYSTVRAVDLWDLIMRSAWDWAEPGVLFIDRINEMNNLWYCETITATNPCGEQPLPPHGACLLGSFNTVRYLYSRDQRTYSFDTARFEQDVQDVVRAMDNVVDRSLYPLPAQQREAQQKRRMGLGITAAANTIEAQGYAYGTASYIAQQCYVLSRLRDASYDASIELAKQRGPFPMYERMYCAGSFVQTLPADIRSRIDRHGIRNSHLTSIAPTGTISYCADNVSSGIEPVFAESQQRRVKVDGDEITVDVRDYGVEFLGVKPKTTDNVTAKEHVDVLSAAQAYVDSAVSKTCNVPNDISWDSFKSVYLDAYRGGAKGCTVYRAGSGRAPILTSNDNASCRITADGRKECGE